MEKELAGFLQTILASRFRNFHVEYLEEECKKYFTHTPNKSEAISYPRLMDGCVYFPSSSQSQFSHIFEPVYRNKKSKVHYSETVFIRITDLYGVPIRTLHGDDITEIAGRHKRRNKM